MVEWSLRTNSTIHNPWVKYCLEGVSQWNKFGNSSIGFRYVNLLYKLPNKRVYSIAFDYYQTAGTAPVAITAYWNASTPAGTSLRVELQDTSTKVFQFSGDSQPVSLTSGSLYICSIYLKRSKYSNIRGFEHRNAF